MLNTVSFDYVLDKGTLDAMLCSPNQPECIVQKMCDEIYRVLRPGGTWFICSFSDDREEILLDDDWNSCREDVPVNDVASTQDRFQVDTKGEKWSVCKHTFVHSDGQHFLYKLIKQ